MTTPETRHELSASAACFLIAVLAGAGPARAADWPMWRHDAGRSAETDEKLPAELHLQWVRQYPRLRPAWPGVR